MPADTSGGVHPPVLNLGPLHVPYSAISLVTLTVQNSALTILLHYSRTAPNAKPYSAAAAVLLNEILKGSISAVIALNNAEGPPSMSAAHARYTGDAAASPLLSHAANNAGSRRSHSLSLGSEESGRLKRASTWAAAPFGAAGSTAWWFDPYQWNFRCRKIGEAILSPDCWRLAVPACCYVLQNNLQFVAAANLDVATFQVSYQMKILTTAFFSVTMLNRRLPTFKWACLISLAAGVAIVQLQGTQTSNTAKMDGQAEMDRFTGFAAVIMACLTSGFAGVYFEKVLKGSSADLWVRNVQLTLFSLPPALLAVLFPEFSLHDIAGSRSSRPLRGTNPDAPTWLFGNFGIWAMATVLCQVFGGLVTALVIRYSDNIAKGFATSLSILISFAAGVILFDFQITPPFLLGCSVVLASTYYYNQPEVDTISASRQRTSNLPYQSIPPGSATNGTTPPFTVEIAMSETTGPIRRHLSVDHGGPDPTYPFTEYPNKTGGPPQFINLSPFASPRVVAPLADDVSPRSPVPPVFDNQPFGPSI